MSSHSTVYLEKDVNSIEEYAKERNETEQMVPKSMTDKYVLSEVVLLGVNSSNVVSDCYHLQYGLLKKGRE